jgi:hypothetical protein
MLGRLDKWIFDKRCATLGLDFAMTARLAHRMPALRRRSVKDRRPARCVHRDHASAKG